MIRFINLSNQISHVKEFAWFSTVTDSFLRFNGSQTWEQFDEFLIDLHEAGKPYELKLVKFKRLFPRDWN